VKESEGYNKFELNPIISARPKEDKD